MNARIILWVGILWGIAVQSAQSQYIVRSNQQDTIKQASSASVKQRTVNPYDDWMYWWFVPLPKTPPIVIHVESPGDLEFLIGRISPGYLGLRLQGRLTSTIGLSSARSPNLYGLPSSTCLKQKLLQEELSLVL